DGKCDGHGLVSDRQLAFEIERVAIFAAPYARALKLNLGKVLDIEELLQSQMAITPFVAGVDTAGPDRCGDGRAAHVVLVENEHAFELPEPPFHLEPQVPDHELDSRVSLIEMPGTLALTFTHRHLSCSNSTLGWPRRATPTVNSLVSE